jgi:2-dehydro-3-deoxyphosphogluconate aldolase/(4S)-4-hydroxy-2-oxoglutarate aldolase
MANKNGQHSIVDSIRDTGLISILRGIDSSIICDVVEKMSQKGVRLVEVTLDTPDALQSIQKLSQTFTGDMIIGAGTVLDPQSAHQAISVGAKFILAPSLNTAVIACCRENDALPIPGVFSPSEIALAKEAGAAMVKVFPANLLGTAYIKEMLDLFMDLEILAVGGIDLNNVADFISAGALGVGIGTQLVGGDIVDSQDYALLDRRTEQYLQKIQSAKLIN